MTRHNRPVRYFAGNHSAYVLHAINILDTGFDPVFFVDADHQSSLVKQLMIAACNFYAGLKVTRHFLVVKRPVIALKTIVCYLPVIGTWVYRKSELLGVAFGRFCGFVKPFHLGITLRQSAGSSKQADHSS